MNMNKTVIVIGGGPSGMMAAISAKEHFPKARVILMDRNKRLGTKLRLSGGGRCNVTADVSNAEVIEHVPKNGKFLYSALSHFSPKDILKFFPENGTPLKIEDHHRVFPESNKSADIVEGLIRKLNKLKVEIILECMVESLDGDKRILNTNMGEYSYNHLILATGGRTLPGTGSDGTGYILSESLGHSITELVPAEVPLVSNDLFIQEKTLQGLSFHDIEISVYYKKKLKKVIMHDLLFAHFGITGPAALRASFYVMDYLKKEPVVDVSIDFIPSMNQEQIIAASVDGLDEFLLSKEIPKRLTAYFRSISKSDQEVIQLIKKFPMTVYDTRGFKHAFVTNGGVNLKEIDPKTMKSKINPHLSFAGELMDVSAYTGGFNITTAFTSGYTAGKFSLEDES